MYDEVVSDFSHDEWLVVEQATQVRATCVYHSMYPYWLRKAIGIHLHFKYLIVLHRFFDRPCRRKMLCIMGDRFVVRGGMLLKRMLQILSERDA